MARIGTDDANVARFLHLLLLTSERAWAHAMAMKAAHAEDNADQSITGSTRQHIISRLHKAVRSANEVVALLADNASGATDVDSLEAKAYAYALAGAEEFEKQAEGTKTGDVSAQRWTPCLNNYSAARVIYSTLLKATKKDLFKEVLAGTTDPSIRYAAYQQRIPRTVGVPSVAKKFFPRDEADLLKAVEKLDPSALQEEEATPSGKSCTKKWRLCHVLTPGRLRDHMAEPNSEHRRRCHWPGSGICGSCLHEAQQNARILNFVKGQS